VKLNHRWYKALLPLAFLVAWSFQCFAAPLELTLEESINLALKNNYDIKIAQTDRDKSLWAINQAKANKNVSLSFSHVDERYNTPPTIYTHAYTYTTEFSNELSLSLPLYSGGKLESQLNQAKLDLASADLDVDIAKQQLTLNVVTYYFNVLEYRNEQAICQQTVDNYAEHLSLVNTKYNLGFVAKTDVLSSEVDLADARDSLSKAQNNYLNAVATLNNALGLAHDTELLLKDDFKYEKKPMTLPECLAYALNHRPELSQYKVKVTSAEEDVNIAKSGYLPTVGLTLDQGWNDSNFPGGKNSNWLAEVTVSVSVFDSGLTKSKVEQAKRSLSKVQDQSSQKRDTILLDVRQYYLSMREAETRIGTSEVSVNQASENLMIQKARYTAGAGTNIDILDAVLALDKAKKNYTEALYDYNTARANLEQAMGAPVL